MSLPPARSTANLQQGRPSLLPLRRAAPRPASPVPRAPQPRGHPPAALCAPCAACDCPPDGPHPTLVSPSRSSWLRGAPPGANLLDRRCHPHGDRNPRRSRTQEGGWGTVAGPHNRLRCPLRRSKPKSWRSFITWCPTLALATLLSQLGGAGFCTDPVHSSGPYTAEHRTRGWRWRQGSLVRSQTGLETLLKQTREMKVKRERPRMKNS